MPNNPPHIFAENVLKTFGPGIKKTECANSIDTFAEHMWF
jgi:hypothetical protein